MSKVTVEALDKAQIMGLTELIVGNAQLSNHYFAWYCAFRWMFLNYKIVELQGKLDAYKSLQDCCNDDMRDYINSPQS